MISIIIPNFNKQRYLADTLASVVAQDSQAVSQIIVVDDASTDGSRETILALAAADQRIEAVLLDTNRNASHCRNRGLAAARGEFVMFVDSDDLLGPDCCRTRLALARSLPGSDAWVFPMRLFTHSVADAHGTWTPGSGDHLRHFLAHRLDWQTMQPLWRRSFVESIGGFDESFRRLQDPEFHARCLLAGARIHCARSAQPDCFYRVAAERHEGNVTSLAESHLAAAIHFYEVFADTVPANLLPVLSGTLFACLAQLTHWWRKGNLPREAYRASAAQLVRACRIPSHKRLLAGYASLQVLVPLHVPGINFMARSLLGVTSLP